MTHMAVGNDMPSLTPYFSSSSFAPVFERRRLVQVGTDNSASFIRFPLNHRHSTLSIPVRRSKANINLSLSMPSMLRDSQSRSFVKSDMSISVEQRTNPILTNSLLNYRKEQLKPPVDASRSTRLCLSSKPTRSGPTAM